MKIINRKAHFDYTIVDRIEAGIALVGTEVKSLREGHAKLEGAFVRFIDGQPYLVNAEIPAYQFSRPEGYDPKRTRKLLLHKKEITSLASKMDAGRLTLIPLSLYTIGPRIKLEIGMARGKKQYEKREKMKKADLKRDLETQFRGKIK